MSNYSVKCAQVSTSAKKDDMHWQLFDINLKLLGQSSETKTTRNIKSQAQ